MTHEAQTRLANARYLLVLERSAADKAEAARADALAALARLEQLRAKWVRK